jgi:hypothetical protein
MTEDTATDAREGRTAADLDALVDGIRSAQQFFGVLP